MQTRDWICSKVTWMSQAWQKKQFHQCKHKLNEAYFTSKASFSIFRNCSTASKRMLGRLSREVPPQLNARFWIGRGEFIIIGYLSFPYTSLIVQLQTSALADACPGTMWPHGSSKDVQVTWRTARVGNWFWVGCSATYKHGNSAGMFTRVCWCYRLLLRSWWLNMLKHPDPNISIARESSEESNERKRGN